MNILGVHKHYSSVCPHAIYDQVQFPEARADGSPELQKGTRGTMRTTAQWFRTPESDLKNLYSINYFTSNEQIQIFAGLTCPLNAIHDVSDICSLPTTLFFWFLRILKLLIIIITEPFLYTRYIANLLT